MCGRLPPLRAGLQPGPVGLTFTAMPTGPNPETGARTETLTGHVVDIACIRKYPRDELLERARRHSRDCALMGHCIESGYGIVRDDGSVAPLDNHATPLVVQAASRSPREQGLRLRVKRRAVDNEMQTRSVDEV